VRVLQAVPVQEQAQEPESRPVAGEAAVAARQPGQVVARVQESESQPAPAMARQVWPRARVSARRRAQAQLLAGVVQLLVEEGRRLEAVRRGSALRQGAVAVLAQESVPRQVLVAPESA